MSQPLVGIVLGSDSDLPEIKDMLETFKEFGITYELNIISAHRTPHLAHAYAENAEKKGLQVIIACAGGAAHLAGVIASLTTLPVIGVPMQTASLGGLDSLLATVQMPAGVPVATVAIGKAGSVNAAVLAAQIIGVKSPEIREKVRQFKANLAKKVEEKNKNLKI
ncbi:MAG: 5-(carboxyamino)imidazole ribonucleotide mutase [Elusimicrobia bacterium]|nr:5-(carboxyamino)imidazole ribonucleotide mutase [Elusimicrobiota bacterium]MBU2614093.1 5-(carboxyamino)imidazole ribonucleotide mutase [Elusimicrobiota bacterium]